MNQFNTINKFNLDLLDILHPAHFVNVVEAGKRLLFESGFSLGKHISHQLSHALMVKEEIGICREDEHIINEAARFSRLLKA